MKMHAYDIQFAKDAIAESIIDTPYGKGITLPWSMLRDAIETIEDQQKEIDALKNKGVING